MTQAGAKVKAGDFARESSPRTSVVGSITTAETAVDTITADLVSGVSYEVEWISQFSDTVAADQVLVALREDSTTGAQMFGFYAGSPNPTSAAFPIRIMAIYTAAATGSKTFVGCLKRQSGTGTISSNAGATAPSMIIVRKIP